MKKIIVFLVIVSFSLSLCGCVALLVGAAAGAGTAVWLSEKLVQQVNVPYERVINATKSALKSLNLAVTKETQTENVTQIRSKYTDGKEIWIDIRPITSASTKIEVRVGAVSDKEAADKILKKILKYL